MACLEGKVKIKESNKMTPFEMCIEAAIICMELCETRKRGINLICIKKIWQMSTKEQAQKIKRAGRKRKGEPSFARGRVVCLGGVDATVTIKASLGCQVLHLQG